MMTLEIVFVICMTLLALRCLSSMDKQKDAEILRLKKEIKRMEGNNNEQRTNYNQSNRIYNSDRK
jgi:hypothetical protein